MKDESTPADKVAVPGEDPQASQESAVDPSVEPPVEPPDDPPVDPSVDPPVEPRREPPLEPSDEQPDEPEPDPAPQRRGRLLLAAALFGVIWFVAPVSGLLGLSATAATIGAVAAYGLAVLAVHTVPLKEPAGDLAWFAVEAARRVGMGWWERSLAALGVVTVLAGALAGSGEVVVLGIAAVVGIVPLLRSAPDERELERIAPPLVPVDLPEDDDEPKVTRIFEWRMPAVMMDDSHRMEVPISERRYATLRDRNPATEWIAGVPQFERWVHVEVPEVARSARDLRQRAIGRSYSTFAEMQLALSFAQSVEYRSDEETKGLPDHWRYAIETMYEQVGDCEDTTILAAALLLAMGHRVAMLLMPQHAALGIAAPAGTKGHAFVRDGVEYYFAETTAEGAIIGFLPDGVDPAKVELLPM